jgi:hypothetical protein
MHCSVACLLLASLALTACAPAPRRPEFSGGYPIYDCPDRLNGQVKLHAEVRPVELSAATLPQPSIATIGSLGRRLLVSTTPSGLGPGDRIVWSTLTVASFGGTFLGWDRLRTNSRLDGPWLLDTQIDKQTTATRKRVDELSSVTFSPGQLKVARSARGNEDLAGVVSIDVQVMPGGTVVDDAVVNIPQLWRPDGAPLAAEELAPQLLPIRHPPGLDVVQATIELSFIVRERSGEEWSCSAEERTTLVDHASLRQPFWDLGLAAPNSSRREWLALFDPAFGAFRLVFDNPANAHALASWIRATRSTQVGKYSLTAFRQPAQRGGRPLGPTSEEVMQTLRPVTVEDLKAVAVGPAGEP